MADRFQLADFLRRRRTRLTPADVGLPQGSRRRTPGLRREEVAQLAGMSADYYTRLEQRRAPQPSAPMLAALARALRLTEDECDELFDLAGQALPQRRTDGGRTEHVRPGLMLVLDRLHDTPAQVVTDFGDVLARNRMAVALSGEAAGRAPQDRNMIWRWFTDPAARARFPSEEWDDHARSHVAGLRATVARRPEDPRPASLVRRLLAVSEDFAVRWELHDVAARRSERKTFLHPVVGRLELGCEVLLSAGHDQLLMLYTAAPGTEARQRLELLRVIGTQDLARPEPTSSG
jgi:transcriptional regulator with XRE-family HTH domain